MAIYVVMVCSCAGSLGAMVLSHCTRDCQFDGREDVREFILTSAGEKGLMYCGQFNERNIIAIGEHGTVCIIDHEEGTVERTQHCHVHNIRSAAFSRERNVVVLGPSTYEIIDGVASIRKDFDIVQWQLDQNGNKTTLTGHSGGVTGIVVHGNNAYSCSLDGTVLIWDLNEAILTSRIECGGSKITCIAISRNGKKLVFGSQSGDVRLLDTQTRKVVKIKNVTKAPVLCVAVSHDGSLIAYGDSNGTIEIMDGELTKRQKQLIGHKRRVLDLKFSQNGDFVVSAGGDKQGIEGDNSVRLWECGTGRQLAAHALHSMWVNSVSFFGLESDLVVSVDAGGHLFVWKLNRVPKQQPN